jgi:Tfp pilus assembly protein PilE
MSEAEKSESKRLLRTALVVAVVGVVVLVPLAWLAVRMYNDNIQQKVIAANEALALATLENLQAQEQSSKETTGQYATFQQLADAGAIQAPLSGDALVSDGYRFTLRVTPKTDTQAPAYSVNADPVRATGRDATGRRHFFISSEVTGVRYNEERPATAADKPRLTGTEY